MESKNIYRYVREDGGVTVTTKRPDSGYKILHRLIAEDGKILTNDGENFFLCVDVVSKDGWYEVDAPDDMEEELIEQ